ncbi:hypothetical protein FB645_000254, partial [Coemansia sp. IMI 203386]
RLTIRDKTVLPTIRRITTDSKPGSSSYEETAKRQWREYRKWRQHFRWSREQVTQTLRDYALWSALGLLAYYNLHKRQQRQEYEAETFVIIDKLQENMHKLDPQNPLLRDSVWYKPVADQHETPSDPAQSSESGTTTDHRPSAKHSKPVFF